ncbi:MAG: ATP-binding protein, partial [Myxococcota bacterium]|nr:ATP-binding protein [Myxococcota bacterium]
MPGGEEGNKGGHASPDARRAQQARRESRGPSALIDAVFPELDSSAGQASEAPESGPQALLADAVTDLARRAEAERVSAWLASEGTGFVRVAAYGRSAEPPADDLEPDAFEALRRLSQATDLGDGGSEPTSGRLSDASGLTAAVALGRPGAREFEPALAVLALGGPEDGLGEVRPRTLALLEEVARRLDGPLATLATVQRIRGLDENIRWLDRRAALGEMLGEIVHEIRNPLVSVKTFLDLLPGSLDDEEFLTDFRGVVLGEVTRMERLLDSVLQHAQPERVGGTVEDANVSEALETLGALLAHRAGGMGIDLVCQADPSSGHAALSPDALQQVLLNLTLNALGATPAGGEVRVRAYEPAVARGHWVELTVEDSGPGIPP